MVRNQDKEKVEEKLTQIIDPHTDQNIVSSKVVTSITICDDVVTVQVKLGYPANSWTDELAGLIKNQIGESTVVDFDRDLSSHRVKEGVKPLPGVKNIIAVASGKGGVGKSTISTNLALALCLEGARVGILDADIYGPSQPRLLGIKSKPESKDGKTLQPLIACDLQVMSIGLLVEEDSPMIWRGPMVTQALEQMLRNTDWQNLDYLIVDLPPGTGDTQLTLAQKVPVTGSVIVTTPQDLSLIDARKAYNMFNKVNIPVLGIIENMSTHICANCGHEEHIFGKGGGKAMAEQYGVHFIGEIPLDKTIREHADDGNANLVLDEKNKISENFKRIARITAARLAMREKDYRDVFPTITIHKG